MPCPLCSRRSDDPQLTFAGALLRSRGRVIDALDIDEIRWPLAGVKVTPRGVVVITGCLRARENEMGDFVLFHLDGWPMIFLPDAGRWRWRYWGRSFTPMRARTRLLPDRANGMTPSG